MIGGIKIKGRNSGGLTCSYICRKGIGGMGNLFVRTEQGVCRSGKDLGVSWKGSMIGLAGQRSLFLCGCGGITMSHFPFHSIVLLQCLLLSPLSTLVAKDALPPWKRRWISPGWLTLQQYRDMFTLTKNHSLVVFSSEDTIHWRVIQVHKTAD